VAIPEAAETLCLILKLKLEGIGKLAIEKKLNAKAPRTPPITRNGNSARWRASYIGRILRTPSVIGVLQHHRIEFVEDKEAQKERVRIPDGEPIKGYFQLIISPQLFYAGQWAMKSKGKYTGKGGGQAWNSRQLLRAPCKMRLFWVRVLRRITAWSWKKQVCALQHRLFRSHSPSLV
jgi:hypothetical protein